MRMRDDDGHHAMLEAGKAWKRVKDSEKRLWSDWTMVIGPGLMKARAEAMSTAGTNTPKGRGYNTAMAALLEEYRLDDMGETARADILKIMERYSEVEEWRARQKNPADLNHPSRVWNKYRHSAQQADERTQHKRADAQHKREDAKQTQHELAAALERIEELEAAREQAPAALTLADAVRFLLDRLHAMNDSNRMATIERLLSPFALVAVPDDDDTEDDPDPGVRVDKLKWKKNTSDSWDSYEGHVMSEAFCPFYFLTSPSEGDGKLFGVSFVNENDECEIIVDEKAPVPLAKAKKIAQAHHDERGAK